MVDFQIIIGVLTRREKLKRQKYERELKALMKDGG